MLRPAPSFPGFQGSEEGISVLSTFQSGMGCTFASSVTEV